jgi:hypothetical protein
VFQYGTTSIVRSNLEPVKSAYGIFVDTLCQGVMPAWYDERGLPVIYETEEAAQREIVELTMERLQQFLAGERDFDDATTIEDFILPIDVWPDGSVSTEDGRCYGKQ